MTRRIVSLAIVDCHDKVVHLIDSVLVAVLTVNHRTSQMTRARLLKRYSVGRQTNIEPESSIRRIDYFHRLSAYVHGWIAPMFLPSRPLLNNKKPKPIHCFVGWSKVFSDDKSLVKH